MTLLHWEVLAVIVNRSVWSNIILQVYMAAENFTGDGRQKLLCSEGLAAGLYSHLTFLLVLNSFLSVTAFLGNALILIALPKESTLFPPSKLLLRSLSTTDLCVGLISEPLAVTYWMSEVNEHWNICRYVSVASFFSASVLCAVSLMILTAISVDRLLALLLGLKYRQVVTLKRTYVIVISFWIVSTATAAMWFWNPVITLWYSLIGVPMCLLISTFSYAKIFLKLRHHQNQVQGHVQQPNQTNHLNIARYKKAVSTAIWLQLTLVACYLPYGIAEALVTSSGRSSPVSHIRFYTATLVHLNSSLNPILYCWKIVEVRQAVKNIIRQILCHCFSG